MKATTPGPWSRAWIYGAIRHINRNVDESAFYDPERDPQKDANTPNVRSNEGDADLITAAPDLLEAARVARIFIATTCSPATDPAARLAAERLESAIAKAEGR